MARSVAGVTPGRTNRKFLIVALLFGAVTAALFYAVTARGGGSSTTSTPAAGSTQVVVAKVPIQQRTTITADMLQLKSISTAAVIGGAYTSLTDAVGKVTKYPIEVNQQVVASSVVDVSKPSTVGALSLVIPAGMRAVSIQASQILSAGGLILPGDYVDLVWTCCNAQAVAVTTILKNVQVAAVAQSVVNSGPVAAGVGTGTTGAAATPAAGSGQNPTAGAPGQPVPDASTMTLLLKPDQVQLVALAEQTGKLRVDLRGFGDQDATDAGVTLFPQLIPFDVFKQLPPKLQPDFVKP